MKKITPIRKMRIAHRRALLRLIRQHEVISRVQLARKLHMSKSTVTYNISPLVEQGVILETGIEPHHTSGRRSVLLSLNGSYRFVVAVDLGTSSPKIVLANLNGAILYRRTFSPSADASYAQRKRMLFGGISKLLKSAGLSQKDIAAIALSSPGAYSAFHKSYQLNMEYKDWEVERLEKDIAETFSAKVIRENNVNAALLGEFFSGKWGNVNNLLFMNVGMGVGCGIIMNGKLYSGTNGSAGEIARLSFSDSNKPLREMVEINSLVEKIRNEVPRRLLSAWGCRKSELDFDRIVKLWKNQDQFIRSYVEDIANIIGKVIAFGLSMLNCDLVIFGGDYLVFEEQMLPVINDVVRQHAFDPVQVVPSSLRQDASLQGLISVTCDMLLDNIAMERV